MVGSLDVFGATGVHPPHRVFYILPFLLLLHLNFGVLLRLLVALALSSQSILIKMSKDIEYSEKYSDSFYEYRHVILPKEALDMFDSSQLMTEEQWRGIGVQQSRGWEHYMIHRPERHILLFRRALGTDPRTGKPPGDFKQRLAAAGL